MSRGLGDVYKRQEYGRKIEEQVKAMKSEIKGTNSEGKETGTQINDLEQKEKISIQTEQNEETRIQEKNEEMLRNLWDNFKYSNIWIIGVRRRRGRARNWKHI